MTSDSGRHAQRGDAKQAPSEGCQSVIAQNEVPMTITKDPSKMLELAEQWERAAVNHAYRTTDTSHVSTRMSVSEMFKVAASLRAKAAAQ